MDTDLTPDEIAELEKLAAGVGADGDPFTAALVGLPELRALLRGLRERDELRAIYMQTEERLSRAPHQSEIDELRARAGEAEGTLASLADALNIGARENGLRQVERYLDLGEMRGAVHALAINLGLVRARAEKAEAEHAEKLAAEKERDGLRRELGSVEEVAGQWMLATRAERARAEKAEADLAESKRLVEKAEARAKELEEAVRDALAHNPEETRTEQKAADRWRAALAWSAEARP